MNRTDFLKYIDSLRQSETVRRSANNTAYSVADYLVLPLLMIAATPFLVSRLGFEEYGIWMLANTIAGTIGVFNIGLGDATIKYVSSYRAKMDSIAVVRVIRSTLTIYTLLGCLIAALAFWAAPLLVHYVFIIETRHQTFAVQAIQLASIALVVRSIDSVFLSTLRGYERYDLSAKVTMVAKICTVACAIALVAFGYGVVAILIGTISITVLGTVAQAALCRRMISGLSFWPIVDRRAWREVLSFGLYSWIQGVGGLIFVQGDRLLIGSMLGSREVAYYSICVQLAQQIHSVAAAGFNFLFPLVSGKYENGKGRDLRQIYRNCVAINLGVAMLLWLPLVLLAKPILSHWMDAQFANQSYLLLVILSSVFFLLSINVVPHYTLLGLGKVRFVAISNVGGGLLSLIGVAVCIPVMGLNGAAVGRLLYGPVTYLNYLAVAKSI